jgi:hypothetical protein
MIHSNSYFIHSIARIVLLLGVTVLALNLQAQQDTAIVRTYGGPFYEEGREIIECAAGGYAIIGTTGSDQLNNTNIYLLRLDENLDCVWNRNYGGPEVEWGYSLVENAQGHLLLCGYTNSEGHGGYDIIAMKVDEEGNVVWQQTYGGTDWDLGYKIIAHPTEGYLICGKTYSYGNGGSDGYLLHINEDGNLLNEWTYGGEGDDELRDMELIPNTDDLIIFGTHEINGIMTACTRKLYIASGETIWTHNETDGTNNFFGNALHCDNENIFLVGNRKQETIEHGFYRQLTYDGVEGGWFLDNYPNSYVFYDVQSLNNSINVIGGTKVFGYGGMDCLMYRLSFSGIFEGGFFYGDTSEDFFSSFILDEDKMVFTGARQNPESHQWQSLAMLYIREILTSENNMDPVDNICLTVGIEMGNTSTFAKNNYLCNVHDVTGKIVLEKIQFDHNLLAQKLGRGFYIVHDIEHNQTHKISIN